MSKTTRNDGISFRTKVGLKINLFKMSQNFRDVFFDVLNNHALSELEFDPNSMDEIKFVLLKTPKELLEDVWRIAQELVEEGAIIPACAHTHYDDECEEVEDDEIEEEDSYEDEE